METQPKIVCWMRRDDNGTVYGYICRQIRAETQRAQRCVEEQSKLDRGASDCYGAYR